MRLFYEVTLIDEESHEGIPGDGTGDGTEHTNRGEAEAAALLAEQQGGVIANVLPVIECCGNEMYATSFTNTCDVCGRDYNSSGQLLAPRSQWGEETGEMWNAGDIGYADPDSAFEEV